MILNESKPGPTITGEAVDTFVIMEVLWNIVVRMNASCLCSEGILKNNPLEKVRKNSWNESEGISITKNSSVLILSC